MHGSQPCNQCTLFKAVKTLHGTGPHRLARPTNQFGARLATLATQTCPLSPSVRDAELVPNAIFIQPCALSVSPVVLDAMKARGLRRNQVRLRKRSLAVQ